MSSPARISRADQLRAIADPTRQSILRTLMVAPATISQLGARRGKHPAWVRHHIKALEAAGLVSLVETRTTRNFTEKFYGATAPAFIIENVVRPTGKNAPLLVFASHDLALGMLAERSAPKGTNVGVAGSLDSLIALRQGAADIAGCHLLDAASGEYNVPYVRHLFPDRDVIVATVAHRDQGFIVAPGNPHRVREIADLARPDLRLVNRNRGSGTRIWLDHALSQAEVDRAQLLGYQREAMTHTELATAIARGSADVGVGIRAAAHALGLGFVPLFTERYDLIVPRELADTPRVARLLDTLQSLEFRRAAAGLDGYCTDHTGDEVTVCA